ncbi:hypothetical protein [Gilvimarinus agarilyticus]|uniref:hypothetical protein n=1 Tax=Gilvimarinus agarilyticus TaxID=679259 RepID=UPI0012F728BE|nr:hypothetical protein [Gilvimarinus agarilyticus]
MITSATLLSACASVPPFSESPACAPTGDRTVRLIVNHDKREQPLLLRIEGHSTHTVFVALDTIGSPQFSATLSAGQLQLDVSPWYRGLDPQALVWGYYWWSLPDQARKDCAQSTGLQLQQTDSRITLAQGGRSVWRWSPQQEQQYQLPQQGGSVSVVPLKR